MNIYFKNIQAVLIDIITHLQEKIFKDLKQLIIITKEGNTHQLMLRNFTYFNKN